MKRSNKSNVLNGTLFRYCGVLLCSTLLSVGSQALAQIPGSSAAATGLSGNYILIPQHASGLCVDVYGAGTSPGTNVDAWYCTQGSNQTFTFVNQGYGIYQIQPSYATGLCLDVYGAGTSPGTSVDAWYCNGATNQLWSVISDGGNIYELAPQNAPGLRLDVYGAGTSPGTPMDVWLTTGGSNQKFLLCPSRSIRTSPGELIRRARFTSGTAPSGSRRRVLRATPPRVRFPQPPTERFTRSIQKATSIAITARVGPCRAANSWCRSRQAARTTCGA